MNMSITFNPRKATVVDMLLDMQIHGQSVTLNWGEDNNLWECSWITSGRRYSGFHENMFMATLTAYTSAMNSAGLDP